MMIATGTTLGLLSLGASLGQELTLTQILKDITVLTVHEAADVIPRCEYGGGEYRLDGPEAAELHRIAAKNLRFIFPDTGDNVTLTSMLGNSRDELRRNVRLREATLEGAMALYFPAYESDLRRSGRARIQAAAKLEMTMLLLEPAGGIAGDIFSSDEYTRDCKSLEELAGTPFMERLETFSPDRSKLRSLPRDRCYRTYEVTDHASYAPVFHTCGGDGGWQ